MIKPLVSVIIATYKRNDELKRALGSLALQEYNNFEIVLLDDSADKEWNEITKEISEEFKADNFDVPFIYIANEENLGSAMTRNKGIGVANGKYITFLDDDDEYLPLKIENQVDDMLENESDFSITDLKLYDENGRLIDNRVRNYIRNTDNKSLFKYHLMHHITGTDTMMFKKEYLEKIGGFSPIDLGDEFYLMEKAIAGGGKFSYLNSCDVKAYVHTGENGLSSGETKIKCENELFEFKKTKFCLLDFKTKRYIKMRHYAVLAFAYLRLKKAVPFFANGIKSFFSSPIGCIKLVVGRKM